MNRTGRLVLGCVLGTAAIWSLSVIAMQAREDLACLRGAVTCDCKTCGDTTKITDECNHNKEPWPPSPEGNPCSATMCIRNVDHYPECPEKSPGGGCPTKPDWDQADYEQYLRDGAPSDCANPDYSEWSLNPTECKRASGDSFACVTGGDCTGRTVQTIMHKPRTVCDVP
jgi:hypothetical protein